MRLVPGIGMISSPCWSSQARATCPAVALYLALRALRPSAIFRMSGKHSWYLTLSWNHLDQTHPLISMHVQIKHSASLGLDGQRILILTYCPVKIPRPIGLYATTLTPNSRAVASRPICGFSISKMNGEYSTSMAAMGWTACARRRLVLEHSERPK